MAHIPWRAGLSGACAALLLASLLVLARVAAAEGPPEASQAITSQGSTVIGESVRGRPLEVGCTGTGDRTVLLVGGMHTGSEAVSTELALEVAGLLWTGGLEVPSQLQVCLLPALNPDGIASGGHRNANDVDLNRNWPAADWRPIAYHPDGGLVSGGQGPLSEPETRALYDYVAATRPAVVVVWHCCAPVVEASASPRAVMLAQRYAEATGQQYIDHWTAYDITGEFIDAMDRIGIPAIDVELRDPDETDLALHRAGLEAVFEALLEPTPAAPASLAPPASAPVREASAPASTAPSTPTTVYRVQAGDTLANIAARFGTDAWALAAANGLGNIDVIVVGQLLTIPSR